MYPKTFFADHMPEVRSGTCFAVMPFADEFDAVFSTIKDGLEDAHLLCTRTTDLAQTGNIIEDILRGIGESEFVVVDVTGKNPNVFYELGIAHMCKELDHVVLLTQDIDWIPFDLRHFRHIVYATDDLASLREKLRDAVGAAGAAAGRITIDAEGKGALPKGLLGSDHCLYQFRVLEAFSGDESAKFLLEVTRQAMGAQGMEEAVVFKNGLGLAVGESTQIRGTGWTIRLERVVEERPTFRIEPVDA